MNAEEIQETIEIIRMEPSYPTLLGAAGAICEHVEELQRRLDAIRAIVESDEWRRVDMTNYDRQMQRIEDVINNNGETP